MKLGICLPGGGAKGAFQGGALNRIFENAVRPSVVTGTSIGAVNAYFIMQGQMERLFDFWHGMENFKHQNHASFDKVIDNSALIEELSKLEYKGSYLDGVFVNYVGVENRKLIEMVVDIRSLEKAEALEAVKYSSLLPFRAEGENTSRSNSKFDSQRVFENFKEDVAKGVYDGYKLDGGILNNNLLTPFVSNKVDRLLIIPLKRNYLIPEYLFNHYKREEVIVVEPDVEVAPEDTLRFEDDYCRDMYERGYRLAGNIIETLK